MANTQNPSKNNNQQQKKPHHRKIQPQNRGTLVLLCDKRMEQLKSSLYPCMLWSGTTELWKWDNCTRFFKLLTYYYWIFHANYLQKLPHSRQECSARLCFSPKHAVQTSQLKEKGQGAFPLNSAQCILGLLEALIFPKPVSEATTLKTLKTKCCYSPQ